MKKVYLIGIGTNGTGSLTADAAAAVSSAGLLIGAKRMLEPYAESGKEMVSQYHAERIAETISSSDEQCAAVLFSGDTGFFSGAGKLLPLLQDFEVAVLPGISSVAAFCAKCGVSYEDMKLVSLHGKMDNIAIHVHMNRRCFFLLGGNVTAAQLCARLCDYGLSDIQVSVGMNLGYKNETILHGKASDFAELTDETLTVLMTDNPQQIRYIPSAISDTDFIRGSVPMTKAEVRCNAVAALRISHDAVLWDIGCGTGSVSIEAAFRCPDGQVYAFDHSAEAAELTEQNARRFSCDNITAVCGKCPEILNNYPAPDAVFIGGSDGRLSDIFAAVSEKNHAANVAMTVVSLETLALAQSVFEQYCGVFCISQIAVTRTKKRGSHTMPDTQNPVWLISGGLQCGVL